jgi:hypothetical protein
MLPPTELVHKKCRLLTRDQLVALLCPAFTLDATGGLGVAVFELHPDERPAFDRDALTSFAKGREGWQGIQIGKVEDDAARAKLACEAELARARHEPDVKAARKKEERLWQNMARGLLRQGRLWGPRCRGRHPHDWGMSTRARACVCVRVRVVPWVRRSTPPSPPCPLCPLLTLVWLLAPAVVLLLSGGTYR